MLLGCFRKHKTNIVAYKPPNDHCLLGQVTQHNLHLSAACSSTRAIALDDLSAFIHVLWSLLLAHQHTWAHCCQGLHALHLAHDCCSKLQEVTRGSLSLMFRLSTCCPLLTLHLPLWSYLTSSHTASTQPVAWFFLWHGASLIEVMWDRTIGLRPLGHRGLLPET